MKQSRREFLKNTGYALSASALMASFKTLGAADTPFLTSAASNNYQALVCVFLYGGNDGNNMLIPYDNYADYNAVRTTTAQLNIPKSDLLQIKAASQGNQMFGLHPGMPELQAIYQTGKLAILSNVGTLVKPITRQQYLSGSKVPDQLFSHADQQNQWQTASTHTNDSLSLSGWGGRTLDYLASLNSNSKLPGMITFSGNAPFTLGVQSSPFAPGSNISGFPSVKNNDPRYKAFRTILAGANSSVLISSVNKIVASAIDNSDTVAALNATAQINTVFPNTSLGNQLLNVAKAISMRQAVGAQRQIFFVSLGGFDTHTNQLGTQGSPVRASSDLLLQLSQALSAFYQATNELQVANKVTTFTLSDFSRTFLPSAGGGSDHAWGNHHLILGGSVLGGDIYGKFPSLKLGGADDSSNEGRWIPTTSIEQYAATLTSWFGLNNSQLATNFPNLSNFSTKNIGFMI